MYNALRKDKKLVMIDSGVQENIEKKVVLVDKGLVLKLSQEKKTMTSEQMTKTLIDVAQQY